VPIVWPSIFRNQHSLSSTQRTIALAGDRSAKAVSRKATLALKKPFPSGTRVGELASFLNFRLLRDPE
jgi:hypothetical protein